MMLSLRSNWLRVAGLLAVTLTVLSMPVKCEECSEWRGVKEGETCAGIAWQAGLTEAQLHALNPELDCRTLSPGSALCVEYTTLKRSLAEAPQRSKNRSQSANTTSSSPLPSQALPPDAPLSSSPPPPSPDPEDYVCASLPQITRRNDTCDSFAERYRITVDALEFANPLLNCSDTPLPRALCTRVVPLDPEGPSPSPTPAPVSNGTGNGTVGGGKPPPPAPALAPPPPLAAAPGPVVVVGPSPPPPPRVPSPPSLCQKRLLVTNRSTVCVDVYEAYGLSLQVFLDINPGIKCAMPLPVNSTVCINSTDSAAASSSPTSPSQLLNSAVPTHVARLWGPVILMTLSLSFLAW